MAEKLIIENARLFYTNFTGKGSKYNAEGKRNFCVSLPNANVAEKLERDGWRVRSRGDEDNPEYYIAVNLSYDLTPPEVCVFTRNEKGRIINRTPYSEETVSVLDSMRIDYADLTINPYRWNVGSNSGIKGYVTKLYVNVTQDSYEDKYRIDDQLDDDDMPF